MDVASVWINAGLLIATAFAAFIAWRGVHDARKARDDAREYERSALAAAESSAAAAERSVSEHKRAADALERQAAIAESAAEIRRPWDFKALTEPTSDQLWAVKNVSDEVAYNVHLGSPAGFDEAWLELPGEAIDSVAPGETIQFKFRRRLSSPKSATVWVFWTPADGSAQKQFTETIN
jgi:hypothetical protein